MNPQCGYYQTGQQSSYSMNSRSPNQNQRQQTYGGASYRPGSCPTNRLQPTRSRSSYGYSSSGTRAPPVFGSPSSGNIYNSNGSSWADVAKSRQNVGRSCRPPVQVPTGRNGNYQNQMAYQYQQQQQPQQAQPQQHPLAPAPFCTPQAIKVNVTAAQLQNAKNSPIYQDRGEAECPDVGQGAKYIQLNWQDLLGGMENMRVSMAPSADPGNQNRQLKVSFGGQKTDPPQAGETALKVVSIEPATTGRMDLQQGNAFAGAMKVCNPQQPQQLRMRPTANASQNYGGRNSYGESCRR